MALILYVVSVIWLSLGVCIVTIVYLPSVSKSH